MRTRAQHAVAALMLATCTAVIGAQAGNNDAGAVVGSVFTASNQVTGNAILAFDRLTDGQLQPAGTVPTGGAGTGAPYWGRMVFGWSAGAQLSRGVWTCT